MSSFEEAIDHLVRLGPEAKALAGGCSLLPLLKLRLAQPSYLVDIGRITGAMEIGESDGMVRLGALVRESELASSTLLARRTPVLTDAAVVIADPIVRNMGTLGGNLAHGDPANDLPAVMIALGATFEVRGPAGARLCPAGEFYHDMFETELGPTDLIVAVTLPVPPPNAGSAYVKFERQVGDFAIAAAAVSVIVEDGRIVDCRVVLTNAGPTPQRAPAAEDVLRGQGASDDDVIRAAADEAGRGIDPWPDLRGSVDTKRRLASEASARALRTALVRAGSGAR